ncbi:MAG: hypothetical protein R3C56_35835 [Pirellulaceae bacterium]
MGYIAALCGFGTLLLILGGSFFKINRQLLRTGGASVAESLGRADLSSTSDQPNDA